MLQCCRPTLAWLVHTPAAPAKGRAGEQNNLHSKESHIIISHKIHAYCFDDALQVHRLQTRLPPPPGPRHLCDHLQVSLHLEEITGSFFQIRFNWHCHTCPCPGRPSSLPPMPPACPAMPAAASALAQDPTTASLALPTTPLLQVQNKDQVLTKLSSDMLH